MRLLSASLVPIRVESDSEAIRMATSMLWPIKSTTRSLKFKVNVTSRCSTKKEGIKGAMCWWPKPAGAEISKWPLVCALRSETADYAFSRSDRMRWQSSKKALPSSVSAILRVVRCKSLTPSRPSKASRRHPYYCRRNAFGTRGSREAPFGRNLYEGWNLLELAQYTVTSNIIQINIGWPCYLALLVFQIQMQI